MPSLNRSELALLAHIDALNAIGGVTHRRDALWQVERAGNLEAPCCGNRANGYGLSDIHAADMRVSGNTGKIPSH
jgi:hypothetical protein